jgi:hypothetical protein
LDARKNKAIEANNASFRMRTFRQNIVHFPGGEKREKVANRSDANSLPLVSGSPMNDNGISKSL